MIGIYAIKQRSTETVYVGRSVNIVRRWVNHRSSLNLGKHHAPWLQRAWAKHGAADFEFLVLEECSVELLSAREAFWLASYPMTFNNMRTVDGGVITHGHESRAKMSVAQLRRFQRNPAPSLSMHQRERIGLVHRGKVVSMETRAKQSTSAKSKPPVSDETREKLRQAGYRRVYGPMGEEQKEKLRKAHTGKTLTPEHRAKIRMGLINAYAEGRR